MLKSLLRGRARAQGQGLSLAVSIWESGRSSESRARMYPLCSCPLVAGLPGLTSSCFSDLY